MMQIVDLTRPHGFLVWRGKQQALVSPSPLPVGDVMITSDGEAFGIATLSQPSQVSLSEFERESSKHCMWPEERQELWPQVESFYLYDIKMWKGFGEPWLIVNATSEVTIENSKGLLKTIIIHPDANGSMEDMAVTLEAHFNCVKHEGDKALPFYELKLSKEPILKFEDVKKKEVTTMPYDIDSNNCVFNTETDMIEKCHDSPEEARAHLTALNINVEEKAGRRLASSMLQRLRDAKDMLIELAGWAEYSDQEEESMADMLKGQSGVAIKMVEGEPWHLSWSSNSFEDRDQEIFSLKSLEQYVTENSENEVKGYFNLWHIKGTDFAEKRFQAIVGKFLFEAGPYLKDSKGQAALKFFKQYPASHPEIAPEGWGASVEYKYLPEERQQKLYQWTWITRTSTLARGAAANVWTKSAQQEFTMNDEQRKAAEALFGEEFTNGLVAQGQQKTKELEDAGIANKQAAEANKEEKETTEVDANQLVNELAAKMQASLNEGLTPVLTEFHQRIVTLGEQVQALGEEIKTLKGEQALKAAVEMPRFTFQALRASQSPTTKVPEGDALKDKKPAEAAPVLNTGSLVSSYFPTAKGQ